MTQIKLEIVKKKLDGSSGHEECHAIQVININSCQVIMEFFGRAFWVEDLTIKQVTEIEQIINMILDKMS